MREWIIGLTKAAAAKNSGVNSNEWLAIESSAGLPVPGELRELYEAMDGARLNPDVRLIRFRDGSEGPSVLDQSRAHLGGLPDRGIWLFGVKGDGQQLFSVRRRELSQAAANAPEWLAALSDDDFVYGIRKSGDDIKYYRTLEQLLTRLVPPAQTEEFGDITYARALSAVQGALDALEDSKAEAFDRDEAIGRTTKVELPERLAGAKAKPAARKKSVAPKNKPKAKATKSKPKAKAKAKAKKTPARSAARRAKKKR